MTILAVNSNSIWERAALISLFILIGAPALTLGEAFLLSHVSALLIIINITADVTAAYLTPLLPYTAAPAKAVWPMFLAAAIQLLVVITMAGAYLALPDV